MASSAFAVVAGVGPGTGASVARKFAAAYPVVLMARTAANFEDLVKEINGSGGKAVGISTDVSDAKSVESAFAQIAKEFPGQPCAAAIFNASGGFRRKPFLETTVDEFTSSNNVSITGAFNFSQAAIPLLLKGVGQGKYSPTLIFTGATASVKSNAMMSTFSTGKWALRALSQSLGKEFGPQGIHVSHAIIDGVIDIPRTKEWMKDAGPDAKIQADAIAESYWNLHTQHRSCFTNEIDIRPADMFIESAPMSEDEDGYASESHDQETTDMEDELWVGEDDSRVTLRAQL